MSIVSASATASRRAAEMFDRSEEYVAAGELERAKYADYAARVLCELAGYWRAGRDVVSAMIDREFHRARLVEESMRWQYHHAASVLSSLRDELWPPAQEARA